MIREVCNLFYIQENIFGVQTFQIFFLHFFSSIDRRKAENGMSTTGGNKGKIITKGRIIRKTVCKNTHLAVYLAHQYLFVYIVVMCYYYEWHVLC